MRLRSDAACRKLRSGIRSRGTRGRERPRAAGNLLSVWLQRNKMASQLRRRPPTTCPRSLLSGMQEAPIAGEESLLSALACRLWLWLWLGLLPPHSAVPRMHGRKRRRSAAFTQRGGRCCRVRRLASVSAAAETAEPKGGGKVSTAASTAARRNSACCWGRFVCVESTAALLLRSRHRRTRLTQDGAASARDSCTLAAVFDAASAPAERRSAASSETRSLRPLLRRRTPAPSGAWGGESSRAGRRNAAAMKAAARLSIHLRRSSLPQERRRFVWEARAAAAASGAQRICVCLRRPPSEWSTRHGKRRSAIARKGRLCFRRLNQRACLCACRGRRQAAPVASAAGDSPLGAERAVARGI